MNSTKQHYTPEFKLHAVLESFQRDRTCREVCRHVGISPSMLHRWRHTFLERAPTIFQPPPDLRSPAQTPGYAPDESPEELKRIIADLLVQQGYTQALEQANGQMETFLGIAGHELNTPLTSLKLSLQRTARRFHHLSEQQPEAARASAPFQEHAVQAERCVERLERLVDELLDVSRIRAGKLELHLAPADLTAIVCQAVEEQHQVMPDRSFSVQLPTGPLPVTVDAQRIGQVVTNYLTNALKYSPAESPIEVGIAMDDQQARVWVRDAGPGVPGEDQERIWDCFYRAKGIEVQCGSGIGLGLGLHICRTIMERHRGHVGVESAPGQGSTFWFTLPLTRLG